MWPDITPANRRTHICAHTCTQTCACKHSHARRNSHTRTPRLSCSLLTTRWQYSSLLLAFCQGLLLPLSSSPPANFIIIMFLIIPESQRKRHAVLHFLGRRVQRRFWHRLQSERRLLTTVSARSDGITQRGECEIVRVCMCVKVGTYAD